LVNISNNDIVDGNPKLTLGLVWSIILHWQVPTGTKSFIAATCYYWVDDVVTRSYSYCIVPLLLASLPFVTGNCVFSVQVQDVLKGNMAELQPQSNLDKTLLNWCQEATKVISIPLADVPTAKTSLPRMWGALLHDLIIRLHAPISYSPIV